MDSLIIVGSVTVILFGIFALADLMLHRRQVVNYLKTKHLKRLDSKSNKC